MVEKNLSTRILLCFGNDFFTGSNNFLRTIERLFISEFTMRKWLYAKFMLVNSQR